MNYENQQLSSSVFHYYNSLRWSAFKRVKFGGSLPLMGWSFAWGPVEGAHIHFLLCLGSKGRRGEGASHNPILGRTPSDKDLCDSESSQFHCFWTQLWETSLDVSAWLFSQRFNRAETFYSQFGWSCPIGCHPRLNNKDRSWKPGFFSLCFLTVVTCGQLPHILPLCIPLPTQAGLCPLKLWAK